MSPARRLEMMKASGYPLGRASFLARLQYIVSKQAGRSTLSRRGAPRIF